jgi:ribosomal protein L11 methyltransferase
MLIIRLSIETDARLVDALSDYLVGVLGAAVECGVDEGAPVATVHAFLQPSSATGTDGGEAERRLVLYGEELAAIFGVAPPRITRDIIADQDWATSWQEHFRPFTIVPGLVIAPTWEEYRPDDDEQVIVMDPGMAFGTGHHATTRLCLELLRQVIGASAAPRVLDVGTGTGILAMAAVLFGAAGAVALDNDPEAVRAAAENVRSNKLQARVEVSSRPLGECGERYQVVVANIVHDTLLDLAGELARVTDERGSLLLSGLICGAQVTSLLERFTALSFRCAGQLQDGEWCALHLVKTGD